MKQKQRNLKIGVESYIWIILNLWNTRYIWLHSVQSLFIWENSATDVFFLV